MPKTLRSLSYCAALLALCAFSVTTAQAQTPLTFSKAFSPDTIGPGSTTTLTFTIVNNTGTTDANLAFTDTLPAGMTIADPASASTTCGGGAILSAPAGGTTISLTDGTVGASPASCTVTVNITATATGTNTSGDLTSDAGNSGPAVATLTVNTARPGFSKSFSPNPIALGQTSTLTFTIDNTANAADVIDFDFTDNLPVDMVIATPANASTTCGDPLIPPTLTASSGTSIISLDALGTASFPALDAGATCTVTVDVTTTTAGTFDNVSEELFSASSSISSGFSTASLGVGIFTLIKTFTDDPVAPGGTVTLEFRITNLDRTETATNYAFTDTLGSVLAGLSPTGLPISVCNGGTLDETAPGSGILELSGPSSLAPGASCTFSVTLSVPGGATPGTFPNTTSDIAFDLGGSPTTDEPATDNLLVDYVPIFTKAFTDDPVGSGATVTLEFTITNTNPDAGLDDIAFTDNLDDVFSGLTATALPPAGFCGPGSSMFQTAFPTALNMTGGSLGEAGMADDSCTFTVTLQVPVGAPPGTYANVTSELSATPEAPMLAPVFARPATDDLVVVGAPRMRKSFTDDPVLPGGTVTLEFTITHDATATGDATAIAFTDDLDIFPSPPGLSPTGLPIAACNGGTLAESPAGTLDFSGGLLTPGETCTFSVSLTVPATAPNGIHTNTTSNLSSTVDGVTVQSAPASDDLVVQLLTFTKAFTDDPVMPGDPVTLDFTITLDASATGPASIVFFSDDLGSGTGTLPGLAATGPPTSDTCGGTLAGTTSITYTGGSIVPGASCTISVPLLVPGGASAGTYPNVTSALISSLGPTPPATDVLEVVEDMPPGFDKGFAPNPIEIGGVSTLTFTIDNIPNTAAATALDFTDGLPAGLVIATPSNASTTCTGGTLTAPDGGGSISYSGGSVAAGASCTVSVDVTSSLDDVYINVSGDLTSSLGNSGPATDELTVTELADIAATKTDVLVVDNSGDVQADPGDTLEYTILLENTSARPASGVVFTDTVDPNTTLVCASVTLSQGSVTNCDDVAGTLEIAVGAIAIAGSATITFQVTINGPLPADGSLTEVCNQGDITGDNVTPSITDDPDAGGADDPTCTPLDVPTVVLLVNEVDYDQPATDDAEFIELANTDASPLDLSGVTLQLVNGDGGGAVVYDSFDLTGNVIPANDYFVVCSDVAGVENCDLDVLPDVNLIQNGAPDAVALLFDGWILDTVSYEGDTGAPYTETSGTGVEDPVGAGSPDDENKSISRLPDLTDTDDNSADFGAACITPGAANIDTLVNCPPAFLATKIDAVLDGDGIANPGDTLKYTVELNNSGGTAHRVIFSDTLAANLQLVPGSVMTDGAGAVVTEGPNDFVVDLGTFPGPDYMVTVMFEAEIAFPFPAGVDSVFNQGRLTASNRPDVLTDDPDSGPSPDSTATEVVAMPDLVLDKTDGLTTAVPGQQLTYTLTYENDGDQDATGVFLKETVPVGTSSGTNAAWEVGAVGSAIPCDAQPAGTMCFFSVGPLAVGDSLEALFNVLIDNPIGAGIEEIVNTASVDDDGANGPDPTPLDNTAQDTTAVAAMPDITGTLTDALLIDGNGNGLFDPGETIRYTAVVSNNGAQDAAGVIFTDVPDALTGLVVGSVTTTQGTIVEGNTPGDTFVQVDLTTVDGEPLPLAPLASATVTFDAVIVVPFPIAVGSVQTQGVIDFLGETGPEQTLTDDPETTPLLDPTVTPVRRSADLAVSKTASTPTPAYLSEVTFTIGVTNNGPATPVSAIVKDVLPAGLVYVSHSAGQGSYEPATGLWKTTDIAFGATATLSITARIETLLPVTNTAAIETFYLPDPDPTNDRASVTVTPVAADLAVAKTLVAFTEDASQMRAVFKVEVTNLGPSAATGVVVQDSLLAGVVLVSTVFSDPTDTYNAVTGAWTVGALAVGQTATMTITVEANASSTILNRVLVFASDQSDPDLTNNMAGAAVGDDVVDPRRFRADLSLIKTVDRSEASVGDSVVYRIAVTNGGPYTTSGVEVTDVLPAGVRFLRSSATTETSRCPTCGYNDSLGVWIVGHLPKDSTVVLEIVVEITGAGEITNTAEVSASHLPDLDSEPADGNPSDDDMDTAVLTVTGGKATSVSASRSGEIPSEYELGSNYPNPFNPETVIPFGMPEPGRVRVSVYNVLGRRVGMLLDEELSAGRHEVVWRATGLPTGVYVVRLEAGSVVKTQRVTLVK